MKFSSYLTQFIKSSGMTKTEIASKLDVSLAYVIGISNGDERPPTAIRCEKLANILKLNDGDKKKLFELAFKERLSKTDVPFLKLIGWE